jgi:hypothetical protein
MRGLVCLLLGGPDYTLEVGGKAVKFEWHHYCGPMPSKQLGPRHMFWTAVTWWAQQGKRVDDNWRCIYDWPPHISEVAERIVGNQWELTGDTRGFDLDDILKYGRPAAAAPAAKESAEPPVSSIEKERR